MEKTTQDDTLLSVKDVARWLRVRPAKVYEMDAAGNGPPSIRIGKLIKFRPESVRRWLEESERQ